MKKRHKTIKPTSDEAAKKVLSDKRVAKSLIEATFKIKCRDLTYITTEQIRSIPNSPGFFWTTIDMLVVTDNGEYVIVEIQVAKQDYIVQRLFCYSSAELTRQFAQLKQEAESKAEELRKLGQSFKNPTHKLFSKLTPIYVITILQHVLFDAKKTDEGLAMLSEEEREQELRKAAYHSFNCYEFLNTRSYEPLHIHNHKTNRLEPMLSFAFYELPKYNVDEDLELDRKLWSEYFDNREYSSHPIEAIRIADKMLDPKLYSKEEKKGMTQLEMMTEIKEDLEEQVENYKKQIVVKDHEMTQMRHAFSKERHAFIRERDEHLQLKKKSIITLRKQGLSVKEISQELNLSQSEIEELLD